MSRRWKVPVALVEYEVREVRNLKAPDGEEVSGLTEFDAKRISIDSAQSDSARVLTFWHEYMHALFHECGYNDSRDNEAKCEAVAQSIPRVVAMLPKRFRN